MARAPYTVNVTVAALICVALPLCAFAKPESAYCPPDNPLLDKHQYLRALSVDLRGEGPSLVEQKNLIEKEDVPESLIDNWLDSDAFAVQVARLHLGLLWNRVMGSSIINRRAWLHTQFGPYNSPALSNWWRSGLLRGTYAVSCLDKPAIFDPNTGELVFELDPETGAMREGWIEVNPYWAPDTTVKVCAADAQTNEFSADGVKCSSWLGMQRSDCGCGPNLNWCATDQTNMTIRKALGDSIDARVRYLIKNNEPYTHLFTNNTTYINGPLAHYWRHLAVRYDTVYVAKPAIPAIMLPDIEFSAENTWVPVLFGSHHAGLLTHAAYLIRHTSLRRRATRFIDGLICQPLVLPDTGLEIEEVGIPDADVTKRPGCKYCHAILEPTAQHWGRWTEFGLNYLTPETHPPCRADCQKCGPAGNCQPDCRFNYVTQGVLAKELKYLGWLKPYQFLVEKELLDEIKNVQIDTQVQCQPELVAESKLGHIEKGPVLLIQKAIFSGQLAQCAAKNVLKWLIGRAGDPADKAWIDILASEFQASGFDYKSLVKSVVTDERYRRVK